MQKHGEIKTVQAGLACLACLPGLGKEGHESFLLLARVRRSVRARPRARDMEGGQQFREFAEPRALHKRMRMLMRRARRSGARAGLTRQAGRALRYQHKS